MLNLNKFYTVKSNATRDIRKAIERSECNADEYEAMPVDGGFQVQPRSWDAHEEATRDVTIEMEMDANLPAPTAEQNAAMQKLSDLLTARRADATETPKPESESPKSNDIPDPQLAVLNALMGTKSLNEIPCEERAGKWIPDTLMPVKDALFEGKAIADVFTVAGFRQRR